MRTIPSRYNARRWIFGLLRRRYLYIATIVPATAFVGLIASLSPASHPHRTRLLMLAPICGAVLAAIVIAYAESTDSRVRGARDLPLGVDAPLFAVIPSIVNRADRRRRARVLIALLAAYAVGLAGALGMLAWLRKF